MREPRLRPLNHEQVGRRRRRHWCRLVTRENRRMRLRVLCRYEYDTRGVLRILVLALTGPLLVRVFVLALVVLLARN